MLSKLLMLLYIQFINYNIIFNITTYEFYICTFAPKQYFVDNDLK